MFTQIIMAPPAIVEEYNFIKKHKIQGVIETDKYKNLKCYGTDLKSSVSQTDGIKIVYNPELIKINALGIIDTDFVNDSNNSLGNLTNETAYDIINKNGGKYILGATSERRGTMKRSISANKFHAVDNLYKWFMRTITWTLAGLTAIAVWSPIFFPREAAIVAIFVLLIGLSGLYIDRVGWRKKFKCY